MPTRSWITFFDGFSTGSFRAHTFPPDPRFSVTQKRAETEQISRHVYRAAPAFQFRPAKSKAYIFESCDTFRKESTINFMSASITKLKTSEKVMEIPLASIEESTTNPRMKFDQTTLAEMASTIE